MDQTTMQVAEVIQEINAAFGEFKAKQDDRMTNIEKAVDSLAVGATAQQMNGSGGNEAVAPQVGPKALRTYGDFKAHFASKGDSRDQVSMTDFLRGVAGMGATDAVKAALSIGTNTSGGYSVPVQTMPQILSALTPVSSLLRAGAGIVPMDEGAKSVTTVAVNTIPTAAWRLEAGNVAQSDPAFRGIVASPKSLAFYFKISRELLADGQGIEAALQTAIAQSFAKALDYAGLRGSGVNPEPLGLLGTAGVSAIATGGANGAALAGYSSFMAATEAMLNANASMPTAAIMAPRSLVKLAGLVDSTGQPLRKPEILANVSQIATSQIPTNLTVGTSNDCSEIYLGDFSKMYFLMRENLSVQLLREAFSTTGEIGFMCHVRADVVVTQPSAFAVVTGVRA
ncbi:phage major capsid protein [Noviherbaspirillum sp. 1P10PC]|uniref:phage major capsid protein n=1 Tax=Noviherbaspirillum sp. 1P10PC TaxID=3132292 RepID=UPI00399EF14E